MEMRVATPRLLPDPWHPADARTAVHGGRSCPSRPRSPCSASPRRDASSRSEDPLGKRIIARDGRRTGLAECGRRDRRHRRRREGPRAWTKTHRRRSTCRTAQLASATMDVVLRSDVPPLVTGPRGANATVHALDPQRPGLERAHHSTARRAIRFRSRASTCCCSASFAARGAGAGRRRHLRRDVVRRHAADARDRHPHRARRQPGRRRSHGARPRRCSSPEQGWASACSPPCARAHALVNALRAEPDGPAHVCRGLRAARPRRRVRQLPAGATGDACDPVVALRAE